MSSEGSEAPGPAGEIQAKNILKVEKLSQGADGNISSSGEVMFNGAPVTWDNSPKAVKIGVTTGDSLNLGGVLYKRGEDGAFHRQPLEIKDEIKPVEEDDEEIQAGVNRIIAGLAEDGKNFTGIRNLTSKMLRMDAETRGQVAIKRDALIEEVGFITDDPQDIGHALNALARRAASPPLVQAYGKGFAVKVTESIQARREQDNAAGVKYGVFPNQSESISILEMGPDGDKMTHIQPDFDTIQWM